MTAASKEKRTVTLPEGVSLRRMAEVLLNAWEADPRRWMNASTLRTNPATEDGADGPPQLREGAPPKPAMPVPEDAMNLFRLLQERRVDYLLVGGMAMLTYVKGRNTKDVDLLMSVAALEKLPELVIEDRNDFFARGKYKSIQVDLLLTKNPLFKHVLERFATKHPFEELVVPTATVEGMMVLKLFALPSLYRQMDLDRAAIYETDITVLLARHLLATEPLLALVKQHVEPGDKRELERILAECSERAGKLRQRTNS